MMVIVNYHHNKNRFKSLINAKVLKFLNCCLRFWHGIIYSISMTVVVSDFYEQKSIPHRATDIQMELKMFHAGKKNVKKLFTTVLLS